jgi:hypothetical protein
MASIPSQFIKPLSVILGKLFTINDLQAVVLETTGNGLFEVYAAEKLPLRQTVFELLNGVSREGVAELVLSEMVLQRPQSLELLDLVNQAVPVASTPHLKRVFQVLPQRAGVPISGLLNDAFVPGMQTITCSYLCTMGLSA